MTVRTGHNVTLGHVTQPNFLRVPTRCARGHQLGPYWMLVGYRHRGVEGCSRRYGGHRTYRRDECGTGATTIHTPTPRRCTSWDTRRSEDDLLPQRVGCQPVCERQTIQGVTLSADTCSSLAQVVAVFLLLFAIERPVRYKRSPGAGKVSNFFGYWW